MNRNDWEKQVYASDLHQTARLIALVVGSFGNWTEDKTVWPSTTAIADMAGMTRDTAQKYLDELVAQGWLRVVKVRQKNIKEYELCIPVAEPIGILAKVKKQMSAEQLTNLSATNTDVVAETTGSSCRNEQDKLQKRTGLVAESFCTNLKEPTRKNLKEPTSTTPSAAAPVVDERLGEESSPLNLEEKVSIEIFEDVAGPLNSKGDEASIKERWIAAHTFNGVLYTKTRDLEEAKRRANTDWWED